MADLAQKFRANCVFGGLSASESEGLLDALQRLPGATQVDLCALRCA